MGIKNSMNHSSENKSDDFSLVLGGPLYQLFIRSRLTTDTLNLVKRRVIVISLFTWLPLLLLSLLSGDALGGAIKVPFFMTWMSTSAFCWHCHYCWLRSSWFTSG